MKRSPSLSKDASILNLLGMIRIEWHNKAPHARKDPPRCIYVTLYTSGSLYESFRLTKAVGNILEFNLYHWNLNHQGRSYTVQWQANDWQHASSQFIYEASLETKVHAPKSLGMIWKTSLAIRNKILMWWSVQRCCQSIIALPFKNNRHKYKHYSACMRQ